MFKNLLVLIVLVLTSLVADSDNPNLWLDWGKNNIKKEIPYNLIYLKNNKIYKGYISNQKGQRVKWISSIEVENIKKINDLFNVEDINTIKDTPYVFVSTNKYPFFKIIRGFIYNCNRKKGCYILNFKQEVPIKIDNINFKFSINDFSGYIFSSPSHNNYAIPYYANPILRGYSFNKKVEFISEYINPIKNMYSMMYESKVTYNFAPIFRKDSVFIKSTKKEIAEYRNENYEYFRFNELSAVEIKELKIKRFGKEVVVYAKRYYYNNILRKYQEAVFSIAFDKEGAEDIANYMCRKGFNVKAAKENGWNWDLVDKTFPQVNDKLYKCKNSLSYYMQEDELWKHFLKTYQ